MIRYANMNDFAVLRKYEHGIVDCQLKESIAAGRIVIMLSPRSSLIGWLRFNLFWDSIPFINLLYLLDEYRGQGYGKQLLRYWENEMAARNYEKALTSIPMSGDSFFIAKTVMLIVVLYCCPMNLWKSFF